MNFSKHKGQHLAECAIVFTIAITAFLAMQVYVKRGLQGRYRDATDAIGLSLQGATGNAGAPLQYEPYYVDSDFTTTVNEDINETVNLGGSETLRMDSITARTGQQTILPAQDD